MKSRVFYRIASVLLVLFAIGHTVGFRQIDPNWHVGSLIESMQSTTFNTQGFTRTYWDFYVGFGSFVSVLLVFAAVVAWQLGRVSSLTVPSVQKIGWALTACFVVITFLCWRYFFVIPLVFSLVITVCLAVAAWLSTSRVSVSGK